MKVREIFETRSSDPEVKLVVVYGGRFQPFHKGHFEAFKWLSEKFGENNVWIASSNKTNFDPKNGDISPFTFKEKKELMVSLYDLDPKKIVQCKNPAFKPTEVFELYKGFKIVYVTAVGAKDISRYKSSSFYKPLPHEFSSKRLYELDTLDEGVGYFVKVPEHDKGLSGTEVRETFVTADDDEREDLFKRFFGRYDSMIDDLIRAKLKDVK